MRIPVSGGGMSHLASPLSAAAVATPAPAEVGPVAVVAAAVAATGVNIALYGAGWGGSHGWLVADDSRGGGGGGDDIVTRLSPSSSLSSASSPPSAMGENVLLTIAADILAFRRWARLPPSRIGDGGTIPVMSSNLPVLIGVRGSGLGGVEEEEHGSEGGT